MKKLLLTVIIFFIFNIALADDTLLSEPSVTEKAGSKDPKDISVRISYGNAAGMDEAEIFGETIESVEDDSNERLEILFVRRSWKKNDVGGMFGAGFFYAKHSGTVNAVNKVEISALGALLQGGLAVKAGETFVIELGPYLGIGWGEHEVTYVTSDDSYDDSGIYGFIGVKGGAFVLLRDNAELGVELGYERFSSEDVLGGLKNSFSGSGPRVAAILTVKF